MLPTLTPTMNISKIDPMLQDVMLSISAELVVEDKVTGIKQTKGIKKNSQQQPKKNEIRVWPNCRKYDFSSRNSKMIRVHNTIPTIIVIPTVTEDWLEDDIKIGIDIQKAVTKPKIAKNP